MNQIKLFLVGFVNFVTGLQFYGVGLLVAAGFLQWLGFGLIASGLIGAFVFKNFAALVAAFNFGKDQLDNY
jgi:hypothetical protein